MNVAMREHVGHLEDAGKGKQIRSDTECIYISYGGTSGTVKLGRTLREPLERMRSYNKCHGLDHDNQVVLRVERGASLPVETLSHEFLKAQTLQYRGVRRAKELFQCSPATAKQAVQTACCALQSLHARGVYCQHFDEMHNLGEKELQTIWEERRNSYVVQSAGKYREFKRAWACVQQASEKVERWEAWRNRFAIIFAATGLFLLAGIEAAFGWTALFGMAFVISLSGASTAKDEVRNRLSHPTVQWHENEYSGKSSSESWDLEQHWARDGEHWTDYFERLAMHGR